MNLTRFIQTLQLNMRFNSHGRAEWLREKGIFELIGENVAYSPRRVSLYPNLICIHNNVNLATGIRFITHDVSDNMFNNKLAGEGRTERLFEKIGCIEIMDNVFVGTNTTILYDVRIGTNVIIGIGSLVNKDIPDNSVSAGISARMIGTFDNFAEKRLKWDSHSEMRQGIGQKHRHFDEKKNCALKWESGGGMKRKSHPKPEKTGSPS